MWLVKILRKTEVENHGYAQPPVVIILRSVSPFIIKMPLRFTRGPYILSSVNTVVQSFPFYDMRLLS